MSLTRLLILAFLLPSIALCDVGSESMRTRQKKIHGLGGYKKSKGDTQKRGKADEYSDDDEADEGRVADMSPEAVEERARIETSFKYAYDNYFASTVRDRKTKELKKQELGKIHLLMMDFECLDLVDEVETYTDLPRHLPEKDEYGDYKERWLYWKTLDSEPEIQDGPTGPVSTRFYKSFWQGVTIRICGDGLTKCLLMPRNCLKSSVAGYSQTTWRTCRDTSLRNVIRCVGSNLAKKFLIPIKQHFETNEAFEKLYGHLKSEKRDNPWNTECIQLNIPQTERRGVDPTIQTAGYETDMTGTHADAYMLDDIVAKSNSSSASLLAGTRDVVSDIHAQRDAGSLLSARGTRWHDDDAYSTFVGEPGRNEWSGSLAPDSCFMVATILDGDESVPVPPLANGLEITPLKYGKPIWPEGFGMRRIESTRRGITNDYHWRGQYFNQFIGTTSRVFHRSWIQPWPERYDGFTGAQLARELKLNIFMAVDAAAGGTNQSGKVDRTAAFVLGQSRDRKTFYFLDGFREKLTAEWIAKGIIAKAMEWKKTAEEYGGTFSCGFEKTPYTSFLSVVLADEQRKLGDASLFAIRELKHNNREKFDRVSILAQPYSQGRFMWPKELWVKSVMPGVQPYDLRVALEGEFVGYDAKSTEDDLIDAHAYAYEMSLPSEWKDDAKPEDKHTNPGTYTRPSVENDDVVDALPYQIHADDDGERTY